MALVLCADIGSSSLKAALIDSSGILHGEERIFYGEEPGPGCWLSAFLAAAGRLLSAPCASTGVDETADPDALVISGSGPTLVPVIEKDGEPESLKPIYWYDAPLRMEGTALSSFFLAKACWFKKEFPARFEMLRYFFSSQEWLSWKLGAEAVTVLPHAGYEPYYWDNEQCKAVDLKRALFPPFVNMGAIIGWTGSGGSQKLFRRRIPIVAGASDFIMALIGTGTLTPGAACDRTGSSEGLNLCLSSVPDKHTSSSRLRILPGAAEGLWNLGAVIDHSGKLFDDFHHKNHPDKTFAELLEDIFDTPSHPGRMVLETMSRLFCDALSDLENVNPVPKELVLSGGQSKYSRWNQHKARISGKILHVPEITYAELAGNAILGILALEQRPVTAETLREKAAGMIRIRETYLPA